MSAPAPVTRCQRPAAKIFAEVCKPKTSDFIAVFHRFIQQRKLDALLIDVADYTHVHHGPGVLLLAHEAYYGMDESGGRVGMLYRQRRGDPEPAGEALRRAARAAIGAAQLIEQELGGEVRFDTRELEVGFDDRLHAPNDGATFEKLRPALDGLAADLFGEATVTHLGDARAPFRARIVSSAPPAGMAALLSRI